MFLKIFIAEVAFCQRQLDEFTAQWNVAATEDIAHRSGKFKIFSVAGNEVETLSKLLKHITFVDESKCGRRDCVLCVTLTSRIFNKKTSPLQVKPRYNVVVPISVSVEPL